MVLYHYGDWSLANHQSFTSLSLELVLIVVGRAYLYFNY